MITPALIDGHGCLTNTTTATGRANRTEQIDGNRATGPRRASETGFRNSSLASTGPYRMNASFMRLERNERGIHLVCGCGIHA
jgi:hypothetical protein